MIGFAPQPPRLTYFDYLIWVDKNPYITQQLKMFLDQYGQQLLFFKEPKQAGDLLQAAMGHQKKFLIICSSRLIESVDPYIRPYLNSFIKYIVFCGSPQRCIQVQNQYKQKVIKAFYHQDQLFQYVDKLDRTLAKNKRQITVRLNWFLPGNIDRMTVRGTLCQFARTMQYKWKIHMRILGKVQTTQVFEFPSDKQIVVVIDNRRNQWDRDYKLIQQAKRSFKNITNVFIIDNIGKMMQNQALSNQYQEFLQANNVVQNMMQLQQNLITILQDSHLFD